MSNFAHAHQETSSLSAKFCFTLLWIEFNLVPTTNKTTIWLILDFNIVQTKVCFELILQAWLPSHQSVQVLTIKWLSKIGNCLKKMKFLVHQHRMCYKVTDDMEKSSCRGQDLHLCVFNRWDTTRNVTIIQQSWQFHSGCFLFCLSSFCPWTDVFLLPLDL